MAYGPMAVASFATTDMVAPGLPIFIASKQVSNKVVRLTVAIPSMDADGSNLTGLTKLTVVTVAMPTAANPLQGLTMTAALALPGVQKVDVTLSPSDAGQNKDIDIPVVSLGSTQAFGAACSD